MCERFTQLTALEAAIAEALHKAPAAAKALGKVGKDYDARQHRAAYSLGGRIDAGEIFADRDLDDLTALLKPIISEIEAGWVTEVIADEHCMSGSWFNHRLTDQAAELKEEIAPLVNLHHALTRVRNLRRAEHIAAKMSCDFNA